MTQAPLFREETWTFMRVSGEEYSNVYFIQGFMSDKTKLIADSSLSSFL